MKKSMFCVGSSRDMSETEPRSAVEQLTFFTMGSEKLRQTAAAFWWGTWKYIITFKFCCRINLDEIFTINLN